MKTAHDPRHIRRIERMQAMYTYEFSKVADESVQDIIDRLPEIDEKISTVATEHGITGMNKVDLAILRQAVLELLEGNKPNIVIDEAIEIAKTYGADNSPKFVNAALSNIAEQL